MARGLVRVFSVVALTATWLVVVLPVALVNRVSGIDLLGAPSPGWTRRPGRGAPTSLWSRDERRPGRVGRRLVRASLVVVVVVLLAVPVARRVTAVDPPASPFGPRASTPAVGAATDRWTTFNHTRISRSTFPGEPWGADLLALHESASTNDEHEVYGWVNRDFASRHLNIEGGRRVTFSVEDPELTVWFFGGSTTFGLGQRDAHTVPSELVRAALADGRRVEVVNFGVSAYVNWQETLVFRDELEAGRRPDLAVFLDGACDTALAWERELYGELDADENVTLTVSDEEREERAGLARAAGWEVSHDDDRRIELTAAQYGRGVRLARHLGRVHDVPVVHFWQPQLASMPPDRPGMATVLNNLDVDGSGLAQMERVIEASADRSGVDPVDLTDVFDRADRPLFFDWVHTNEAGARLLAAAIYAHLRPELPALAR